MAWIQNYIANQYILLTALVGAVLIGILAGVVGGFAFFRKRALLGDVISHAALPGVAAAFLFTGVKNPIYFWVGATVAGFLAVWIIELGDRYSKLKPDVLQAITLSVFFGLGVVMLTHIQHQEFADQSGLDTFLFGNAAALNQLDFIVLSIIFVINISVIVFFYRGFKVMSFDEVTAKNLGFPMNTLRFLLTFITVTTIAVGIQMVGVILMAALMITPTSGAKFLSNKVPRILIYSAIIGGTSAFLGVSLSAQISGLPSGPIIVVMLTIVTAFAIFFGKEKGVWMRWNLRKSNERKIHKENMLKLLYKYTQEGNKSLFLEDLIEKLEQNDGVFKRSRMLKSLMKQNLITQVNKEIVLTESGVISAREIVRKHRLWELYLTKYFYLRDDHVHDDAEGIEHVITPEIEKHLTELLDRPELDPHQSKIPY